MSLMSLYESNHLRLCNLVGDLRQLSGERHSHVNGDCELALIVGQRSPYTTTFELTYRFDETFEKSVKDIDFSHPASAPDMQVRIYHDARLAEALAWYAPSCEPQLQLAQRWQRNVMLNKWLEYCVERGHTLRCA